MRMLHEKTFKRNCICSTKCLLLLTIFRVILDRCTADIDDMWSSLDFTIHDSKREPMDSNVTATAMTAVKKEWYIFLQLYFIIIY